MGTPKGWSSAALYFAGVGLVVACWFIYWGTKLCRW